MAGFSPQDLNRFRWCGWQADPAKIWRFKPGNPGFEKWPATTGITRTGFEAGESGYKDHRKRGS